MKLLILKLLKNTVMQWFDLIERKNAIYYVEIDNNKLNLISDIFKERGIIINKCEKIKPNLKKKLLQTIEDCMFTIQIFYSHHALKLKEIKKVTKEEFKEMKKENECSK